ncbi:hypothetical protein GCM10010112_43600 [Actinoplanes lobatus]|uniref:Uncharacterized protein n=1 Tax=Actinoplanes lobatus TaxID=113568 RepID=A0ABQ4AFU5_9ACTN|nr:hypothetical protein GCM10010112_43600 [Actinoplanes lobatus]GIE39838.1 hypothetical protein Alo02nite_27360 [Actinoplanes lobatus]
MSACSVEADPGESVGVGSDTVGEIEGDGVAAWAAPGSPVAINKPPSRAALQRLMGAA